MATWTDIPDEVLEPGKPIRSVDALALRDNPVAIAEGAAGAPRIQTNAIQNGAITNEKIANMNAGKLNSGTVPGARMPMGLGGVGTYALLLSNTSVSTGGTAAGSSLSYASADGSTGGVTGGTWRKMGYSATSSMADRVTVWVRIS